MLTRVTQMKSWTKPLQMDYFDIINLTIRLDINSDIIGVIRQLQGRERSEGCLWRGWERAREDTDTHWIYIYFWQVVNACESGSIAFLYAL